MKKILCHLIALCYAENKWYSPPTEMPARIPVEGGNSADLQEWERFCVFPFMYKGKVYEECTTVESEEGRPWCAAGPKAGVQNPLIDPWGYCGDPEEMPSFLSGTEPVRCTDEQRVGAGCHTFADCFIDETTNERTCECRTGFNGDGANCVDIDECSDESLNFCDVNYATCKNIDGSYVCQCIDGFSGSGYKGSCFAESPCTAGTAECIENSSCIDNNDFSYGCQCNVGFRGHTCQEICNLFDVECDIEKGFIIEMNRQCRLNQYPHIDIPNTGLTVFAKDLDQDTGDDPDWSSLADECFYGGENNKTVSFNDCGGAIVTYNETTEKYTYHTFVHHRAQFGDLVVRMNDQVAIKCELPKINLDTSGNFPLQISDNDEENNVGVISKEDLARFKLGLLLGTENGDGQFTAFQKEDQVDVGQSVVIKLDSIETDSFRFALKGCQAKASDVSIPLYKEYCPAETASLVQPTWKNHRSFGITVFRIKQDSTLTFVCNVAFFPVNSDKVIFPAGSDYPADCPTSRRKRRAPEPSEETTLELTIELKEEHPTIHGDGKPGNSASAKQCSSAIFLFSMFGYSVSKF